MSTWGCGACGTRYAVGAPRCPQCSANQPVTEHPTSPLASLTVACLPADSGCRYGGVTRRVMLPQIVPGVIGMPDLRCAGCGAAMTRIEEGAQDVPKITAHGGPTNAADTPEEESSPTPEAPGTSSSTSSTKDEPSPETSSSAPSRRARTTGSRSSKARTASSSATGTDGDPADGTSATSSDEA